MEERGQSEAGLERRVEALEESHLFAERLVEQLAEQTRALNAANDALARRFAALERRLGEVDRRVDVLGERPTPSDGRSTPRADDA